MKARYYLLTAAYCIGIFWMSSQPLPPQPRFPGGDKTAHLVVYAGLAAVVSVGLRRSGRAVPPPVQWWVPLLFAALYGLSDEIHQLFVPNRQFDVFDVAADAVGALLMQLVLCLGLWRMPLRSALFSGRVEPSASNAD